MHEWWVDHYDTELLGDTFCAGRNDLSKAFDCINSDMCIDVAALLGLPVGDVHLLRCFDKDQHTTFTQGSAASEPTKRKRGILQGCPWSVVLLRGLMTCLWAALLSGVKCRTFIDDRLYSSGSTSDFLEALHISNKFDLAVGFVNNQDKGVTYGTRCNGDNDNDNIWECASLIGAVDDSFTNLGVWCCVDGGIAEAKGKHIRKKTTIQPCLSLTSLDALVLASVRYIRCWHNSLCPKSAGQLNFSNSMIRTCGNPKPESTRL